MADLALELYDAPDEAEFLPSVQQSFRENGPLAPIFVRNSDGKRFHMENILIEWNKRNRTFFPDDLPSDGSEVRRNLHQPLAPGGLHVETTKGQFDIRVIHIELSLSRTKRRIPISRLTEYADPSDALVQTAEWQDNIRLSLHRDLTTGETRGLLTSEEPP